MASATLKRLLRGPSGSLQLLAPALPSVAGVCSPISWRPVAQQSAAASRHVSKVRGSFCIIDGELGLWGLRERSGVVNREPPQHPRSSAVLPTMVHYGFLSAHQLP